jgi:hypothetical protein
MGRAFMLRYNDSYSLAVILEQEGIGTNKGRERASQMDSYL